MSKPACEITQVLCYARTSTDEQELGLELQEKKAVEWCKERNLPAPQIFAEKVHGDSDLEDREVFSEMIQHVTPGTVVLVLRRDRLARDRVIAGMYEYLVRKAGGRIETVVRKGDDTPEGKLLDGILDIFAEFERQMIMVRTQGVLKMKRARGERVGEDMYGKQLGPDGKTLIDHPEEQTIIAAIRQWRSEGKRLADVMRLLEAHGHRTRTGKPFRLSQVQRIQKHYAIA